MKKYILTELKLKTLFFLLICCLTGCNIKDKKTTMEIVDPVRHYYPILRGQELELVYLVKNTGENPLFITDIHTSCGCVVVNDTYFNVLPPGGKGFIHLKYDSSKNTGYVEHYMTIYANLEEEDYRELSFDVHIVPNALYTKDYEEMYIEYQQKYVETKFLVDGKENNRKYYIND